MPNSEILPKRATQRMPGSEIQPTQKINHEPASTGYFQSKSESPDTLNIIVSDDFHLCRGGKSQ
ncbi:MAG: hypothetical protein JST27_06555 [Bacteroidetes bacterium]|nr:hypothetical protein [Bacteroidota bacterium]